MAELKQFVFFDFEMLCSDNGMAYKDMEAIRLGAVKYDIQTEEISYFDKFIHPLNEEPLSDFCKELTGIKDSDLTNAKLFSTVFTEFLEWIGGIKRTRFFSWSKSDMSRLIIDADLHDLPETTIKKIEKRYVDFQAIFTKRVSKTNLSVENALSLYNLEFVGEAHNPMYDAYNTLIIYLNFAHDHLKTDLIMLEQFGFNPTLDEDKILETLKNDINDFLSELNEIYKIRHVKKIIKRMYKIVAKYENILINRSGIFSEEVLKNVRLLNDFYQEFVVSYQEHLKYSAKVMILHQHMTQPIKKLVRSI